MPSYHTRTAGIYRCRFAGTQEKTITDKDTGEEVVRWLWTFQELADSTTAGEISAWTGTSMASANSNAHKIASGLMGRKLQDGDDTDAKIGQVYDVVYGPNRAGNLAITGVMPAENAPQPVQNAPQAPIVAEVVPAATEGVSTDDLPF